MPELAWSCPGHTSVAFALLHAHGSYARDQPTTPPFFMRSYDAWASGDISWTVAALAGLRLFLGISYTMSKTITLAGSASPVVALWSHSNTSVSLARNPRPLG